jgi:hypothetical protein
MPSDGAAAALTGHTPKLTVEEAVARHFAEILSAVAGEEPPAENDILSMIATTRDAVVERLRLRIAEKTSGLAGERAKLCDEGRQLLAELKRLEGAQENNVRFADGAAARLQAASVAASAVAEMRPREDDFPTEEQVAEWQRAAADANARVQMAQAAHDTCLSNVAALEPQIEAARTKLAAVREREREIRAKLAGEPAGPFLGLRSE